MTITGLIVLLIIAALAGSIGQFLAGYSRGGCLVSILEGTVDGGGTIASTNGSYSLGGAIGQPDAGVMSKDSYTLGGGFWGGGKLTFITPQQLIYLPIILK